LARPALIAALALLSALAVPVGAQEIDLRALAPDPYADPDWPYPLGGATATLGGAAVSWGVNDYSLGAVDPAAWIQPSGGALRFRLQGVREPFRRAPPDRELGDLILEGVATLAPGPLAEPVVTIRPGRPAERLPVLTSRGSGAGIVIDSLDPGEGNARYGRVTGRFVATLCRAAQEDAPPDLSACVPVEGRFDSRLYVDGG
jgi:hypothetical protein